MYTCGSLHCPQHLMEHSSEHSDAKEAAAFNGRMSLSSRALLTIHFLFRTFFSHFQKMCSLQAGLHKLWYVLISLKQICNEYLIKFSKNQSAPKLENRKTSPCSPCAPNLLHELVSRILGYHNLCSPG